MRNRQRLLAIPPESVNDKMSAIVYTGTGVPMSGDGDTDFFCGRCGRIMVSRGSPHTLQNLWLRCVKCGWFNGMDIDLGWAQFVVNELEQRRLSLERIEQILEDIKTNQGSAEDIVKRNPDLGKPGAWIAKISVATLVAVLTLFYVIWSSERSLDVAREGVDVAKEQLEVAKRQATPRPLSVQEIRQIAEDLHGLQQDIQLGPPKSSGRHKKRTKKPRR